MKLKLLALAIPFIFNTFAHATIDSYAVVKIPVLAMNSGKVCLISTLAHDGISSLGTSQLLAMMALNSSFKIQGIQAGEDNEGLVDANMLSGKGISVSFEMNEESFDKGVITIDASEASARAKTLEERSEVIKLIKVGLVAGLENVLDGMIRTVKVNLVGLPNQTGIDNKLPVEFKSNFSSSSPYLKNLLKELEVVTDINKCI
jgi:hypothetical protein